MNWLITAQSKPMALPFKDKVPTRMDRHEQPFMGRGRIDLRMRNNTAKNEEKKYPNMQYQGQGQFGVAYLNPPSSPSATETVVKYTADPTDARAAERVKNNPIPCANKIHDVRIVQYDELGEPSVWVIVADKVRTLDTYEQKIVRPLYETAAMSLTMPKFIPVEGEDPKAAKVKRDYMSLVKCLLQNGMKLTDAHQENVGYTDDGRLVLFDLGFTVSNPNQPPTTEDSDEGP